MSSAFSIKPRSLDEKQKNFVNLDQILEENF
jgi:hypothetical protein